LPWGLYVPKAEYLDTVEKGLTEMSGAINQVWIELAKASEDEDAGDLYHALNDLMGISSKYVEEQGFFHQILEEYF